jgi:single-stranded DNA-binding protein
MNDVNSVVLIGRLTKDADIKYLQSGTAVLNFSLAVNESVKNGDSWSEIANFFDITFYGQQGEGLRQYLGKGKQIAITGTLQQQRWQKDGQTKSKIVVIAKMVQLLGSTRNGNLDSTVNPSSANDESIDTIPF